MDRAAIYTDLCALLEEIASVSPADITEGKTFAEDLHVDSLSMVEVLTAAEDRFDIRIDDAEIAKLKTVGDVLDHLESLVAAA